MAIKCFKSSDDLNSLFLIYSSLGLRDELRELAQKAEEMRKANIAYNSYFLLVFFKKKNN